MVVLWDVKNKTDKYGTFLGDGISKQGGVTTWACPVNCTFTTYPLLLRVGRGEDEGEEGGEGDSSQ